MSSIYLFFLPSHPPILSPLHPLDTKSHATAGWGLFATVGGSSPLSLFSYLLIFSPQLLPPPKHKHPFLTTKGDGSNTVCSRPKEVAPSVRNQRKQHYSSTTGGRRCTFVRLQLGEEDTPLFVCERGKRTHRCSSATKTRHLSVVGSVLFSILGGLLVLVLCCWFYLIFVPFFFPLKLLITNKRWVVLLSNPISAW